MVLTVSALSNDRPAGRRGAAARFLRRPRGHGQDGVWPGDGAGASRDAGPCHRAVQCRNSGAARPGPPATRTQCLEFAAANVGPGRYIPSTSPGNALPASRGQNKRANRVMAADKQNLQDAFLNHVARPRSRHDLSDQRGQASGSDHVVRQLSACCCGATGSRSLSTRARSRRSCPASRSTCTRAKADPARRPYAPQRGRARPPAVG